MGQKHSKALGHPWNVTPARAREIQTRLAEQVITEDRLPEPGMVAGVDVGHTGPGGKVTAAVAVLKLPELDLVDWAVYRKTVAFPYIPGLLSFREVPVIMAALGRVRVRPDVILCDGQGIAHPRRFGLACHLGVLTEIPTIGVAKSRLVGSYRNLPETRGSSQPLVRGEAILGWALRTRDGVKPVYVSPGHRVGLETAKRIVMACVTRFRLPETTRWAHRLAGGAAKPPRP